MTDGGESLFDAQGCLNAAGVVAVTSAPPGQAPAALAAHLAACVRCQRRLLASPGDAARPRAQAPPVWRTGVVFGVMVLLALMAWQLVRWLTTSEP